MQRADSHIQYDQRITTRELSAILGIGKGIVDKIIYQLGYSKVCARWVPRRLTKEHKNKDKSSAWSCLLVMRLRVMIEGDDLSFERRNLWKEV
jgi:hypothetical protein